MDQPKLSATFKVNSKDILGLMALTNHKFARMSGESTRSTHTNYMKPPIFSLFQPTLRCTAGLPFIGAGHHTIPYYLSLPCQEETIELSLHLARGQG